MSGEEHALREAVFHAALWCGVHDTMPLYSDKFKSALGSLCDFVREEGRAAGIEEGKSGELLRISKKYRLSTRPVPSIT